MNTSNYALPGNYVCGMNSTATTLSNSPCSVAFVMRVESSAGSKVTANSTWANVIRTIIPHNDPQTIYRQYISTGGTAGVWTYRDWIKMPTRAEITELNNKTARFDIQITYPSDLNDCKDPGFYKVNPQAQNTPVSGYYSVMVLPYSSNDLAQLAINVNTGDMYCRTLHDTTIWTAWKTISMS